MKQLYTVVAGLFGSATTVFRKNLALALLLAGLAVPVARAQAPAWQAVNWMGWGSYVQVHELAVDAQGNRYLAGVFRNTLALGATTISSQGQVDVFVAKWSAATSDYAWALSLGGTDEDLVSSLALYNGSLYVGGLYRNTPRFGMLTLPTATATDAYVAKITDLGTSAQVAWVHTLNGPGSEYLTALAATPTGVYVTGTFSGAQLTSNATTLTNASSTGANLFVAKVLDQGSSSGLGWLLGAGGAGTEGSVALAVQGTRVYVGGNSSSRPALFGPLALSQGQTGNSEDAFIARLDDDGPSAHFVWAEAIRGTLSDIASALVARGNAVFVALNSNSPTLTAGGATITSATTGSGNSLVCKLTDTGTGLAYIWHEQVQGQGSRYCTALAVNGAGVYLTGSYNSTGTQFGTHSLPNPGGFLTDDLFVARLHDTGTSAVWDWAVSAGSAQLDRANTVAVAAGTVYVGGAVGTPSTFGSIMSAWGAPSQPGFVATLADPTVTSSQPGAPPATLRVHPNPAHHTATLTLPALPGLSTLVLTNAVGKIARAVDLPTAQPASAYPLDLTGLAPGLYLVRLRSGGTQLTQRLVVE
jgi:hypothetical protein